MKRIAAATAFLLLVSSSNGLLQAATLESMDGDALNLRAGPGLQHQVVGKLGAGQAATVVGQEGDWFKVRLSSGQESWVAGWVSRLRYEDEERWAVVDTDVLNVRREPGLQAPILTRLMQEQRVRLLEVSGDWWRVRLPDGTEGWVAAAYVKHAPASGQGDGQGGQPSPGTPGEGAPGAGGQNPDPPGGGTVWPTPAPLPAAPEWTVPDLSLPLPQPAKPMPGKVAAVIQETGLLAGRNSEARRLETLKVGEQLSFVDATDGWVKVQTVGGRTGWIQGPMVQVYEAGLRLDLADRHWMLQSGREQQAPPQQPIKVEMRTVSDPDGLRLRQGPSTSAAILTVLPQGERMEVLESGDAWLRVKTSGGRIGWVFAQYAEPTDPEAILPPVAPPILDENGYRVTLEQTNPGMVRLTVESPAKTVGEPSVEAGVLTIPLATGEAQERSIPVKMLGVQSATVGPEGLRLVLQGQPTTKVVDRAAGKLAISLRPALAGVRQRYVGENVVYSFRVDGQVEPQARAAGENIVIELPGALLEEAISLSGVRVVAHDTGVRAAVNTRRAFALRRTPEGFDLVVYAPGLAGKTILLDPGHGGEDGGAVSRAQGVVEKEVNLQAALRLRALLEAQGARVHMTRATDRRPAPAEYLDGAAGEPRDQVDMQYRTQMANALGVDLFISIHHNAGDPGDNGTETYYSSGTLNGERSGALAQLVQQELVSGLGLANRRAKDDTFYVTRNTEAPAILAELAFINHPVEGPKTRDPQFQEAAARAMLKALERYYAERP